MRSAECEVRNDSGAEEPRGAWLVSLSFWLCLLSAAAIYGSVSLAPKFLTYLALRQQCNANQWQLVKLQRQVDHLSKVGQALENEPDFAAELARIDFDAARPGEERIPVDRTLSLDVRTEADPLPEAVRLPWYTPLVRVLAGHHRLRVALLAAAALLALFAFTFLHESHARQIRTATGSLRGGFRRFRDRYRKDG